jgi:hypothetical protein
MHILLALIRGVLVGSAGVIALFAIVAIALFLWHRPPTEVTTDAADTARVLAESISAAMNTSALAAFALLPAGLWWSLRRARRATSTSK